jgi:hypothetical protein
MKMRNFAVELLEYTRNQILSLHFFCKYRTSPKHFTRRSPLNFTNTSLLILNLIKKAIKNELMNYFHRHDDIPKTPSRQAFTEAREKISYLAFKEFFDKSCELAQRGDDGRLFRGYRLLAVDGTSFVVGKLSKLREYFGESTTVADKAMCRIGGIVDVLCDCIVSATVSPFHVGERVLAIEQIEQLKAIPNALFLFDRGYWSPDLVSRVISNGQKFLMRLACNTGKITLKDIDGHDLRRYSFTLSSGEAEILLTNIPPGEMSDDDLACLYTKRWGIETKYLELKGRLEIDVLSGETVNTVLQDIYSALYISNLNAFICFEADEMIAGQKSDSKYERKAKRSTGLAALRNRFVELCLLDDPRERDTGLQRLVNDLRSDVTYVGKSIARPREKKRYRSSRPRSRKPLL